MFGKKSSPADNLAQTILDSISDIAYAYREKSPYDKSFFCTIKGVNQKFTDDVSADTAEELIAKHNIPEKTKSNEQKYYTVCINGTYYVNRSSQEFSLYESVVVRVPNGLWDNFFIEATKNNNFYLPSIFVQRLAPNKAKEKDIWIEIDNAINKNIISLYIYKNIGTEENPDYEWELQYNSDSGVKNVYFQNNAPAFASENDLWFKTDNYTNTHLTTLYRYNGTTWENKGLLWQVGESVGNGNEIFNDYSENAIENGSYNTVLGALNTLTSEENNPQYIACLVNGWGNTVQRTDYDENDFIDVIYTIPYKIANEKRGSEWYLKNNWIGNVVSGANIHVNDTKSSIIIGISEYIEKCESVFALGSIVYYNARNCLAVGSGINGGNSTTAIINSAIIGTHISASGFDSCLFTGFGHSCDLQLFDYNLTAHSGIIVGGEIADINPSGIKQGHLPALMAIGNGIAREETDGFVFLKNNALYLDHSGNLTIQGTLYQQGADYAETYEWKDGNPESEDRRGLFVTLDGDMIVKADENSDYILGVVSASPTVCGDTYEQYWRGKFKKDVFGNIIYEKNGDMAISENYDPKREYVPQSKRPEKSQVGTHGKLVVIDDGTCTVNGYCKPSKGGVATASKEKTDYRVIERKDSTHIRIVIK